MTDLLSSLLPSGCTAPDAQRIPGDGEATVYCLDGSVPLASCEPGSDPTSVCDQGW